MKSLQANKDINIKQDDRDDDLITIIDKSKYSTEAEYQLSDPILFF